MPAARFLAPLANREATLRAERRHFDAGMSESALMELAAERCFHEIARFVSLRENLRNTAPTWLVVAGTGHNGGDGWALARKAVEAGIPVEVLSVGGEGHERKPLTERQRTLALAQGARERTQSLGDERDARAFCVVIDALIGHGLARDLDAGFLGVVRAFNALAPADAGGPLRIAIDVPSGLCCDTGRPLPEAVEADLTVVIGTHKEGLLGEAAVRYTGDIHFVPLGLSREGKDGALLDAPLDLPALLKRAPAENKLSRGELFLRVGSEGMHGAGLLTLAAARTMEPGYVRLCSDSELLLAETLREYPETLLLRSWPQDALERVRVAVVGCGMTEPSSEDRCALMRSLLPECAVVLDGGWCDPKTVHVCASAFAHTVLTPHAGEFARLLPALADDWKAARVSKADTARRAAKETGCYVILKGPYTAIATPDGRVWQNTTANPALAQAGTGDALAGFVAGVMLQALHANAHGDLLPALASAVWVHGAFRAPRGEAGSRGRALVAHLAQSAQLSQ